MYRVKSVYNYYILFLYLNLEALRKRFINIKMKICSHNSRRDQECINDFFKLFLMIKLDFFLLNYNN